MFFVPPLFRRISLCSDHGVISGAGAARFTGYLALVVGDLGRLLL
jgi:pyruvate/2-oxoglutarate dehydrogenase complex dihydrolipoamide acyltransferase (E2) component